MFGAGFWTIRSVSNLCDAACRASRLALRRTVKDKRGEPLTLDLCHGRPSDRARSSHAPRLPPGRGSPTRRVASRVSRRAFGHDAASWTRGGDAAAAVRPVASDAASACRCRRTRSTCQAVASDARGRAPLFTRGRGCAGRHHQQLARDRRAAMSRGSFRIGSHARYHICAEPANGRRASTIVVV
jgi:hypothetical protein